MSETPTTTEPITRPRLARTRSPRIIAGVCGGVARYLDIDPVLLRVILAVVVVFGGAVGIPVLPGLAILAYLAAWLAVPDEYDEASPIEALFGRGTSSLSRNWTIVLLVVALVSLGNLGTDHFGPGLVVLLAAGGAYAVLRGRSQRPTSGHTAIGTEPVPPFAPHGPYAEPSAAATPTAPPPPPTSPPNSPAPPRPPRAKREHSLLGRFTWSLLLLVVGALVLAHTAGARIPISAYLAAALGVTAVGLLIGAIAGRARGLIPLGILLAGALAISAAASDFHVDRQAGSGNTRWAPASTTELLDHYEHGFGKATLDLTAVTLTADRTVKVDQGIGNLVVIVPSGLDAEVHANLGAGRLSVFDSEASGPGASRDVTDYGDNGPGGPVLELTIDAGAGNVEVRREAA
jgi:phage shock protein PspC (stress-responsive transcriptional regulator)